MKTISLLLLAVFITFNFTTTGQGIIIDHNCTDISSIPSNIIDSIKQNKKFQWCGQSHSHQIPSGLELLEEDFPVFDITINTDGDAWLPEPNGTFCIMDGLSMFGQCGNCCQAYIMPHAYWDGSDAQSNVNKTLIDCYPSINISGFLFCGELETASETYVQNYLSAITNYEQLYPEVTFIYTTGHAQSSGSNGYIRWLRNNQIRQYCLENNKVLFDFGDMDCWYNGEFNSYEYNGETVPLQHPQYDPDIIYHTTEESCKNKAKATWYMMAILSGWDPTTVVIKKQNENNQLTVNCSPNPFANQTEISFSVRLSTTVSVEIYDLLGRQIATLYNDYVDANQELKVIYTPEKQLGSRYLFCVIRTPHGITTKPLIVK